MSNPYGHWATSIDTGRNPQLSSFWRQRLAMLVGASQTSPVLSRRHWLWLGAASLLVLVLPTFRSGPVAAEEKTPIRADEKPAVAPAPGSGATADYPILRGRIVTKDKRPLPGVRVVLYGGLATRFRGQETSTNAAGEYVFAPLRTGAGWSSGKGERGLLIGVTLEHAQYVSEESWRDIRVPIRKGHVEVRDFTMVQGGHIRGKVVDPDSGKPATNLSLVIDNNVLDRDFDRDLVPFTAYAETDGHGEFLSKPLFPQTYIIEINDNNFQGRYKFPKIGKLAVASGEVARVSLTTRERPELQDPFIISGVARGANGEAVGYAGRVRIRLIDSKWQIRSPGGGIAGDFHLRFGPVERTKVTPDAPFGVGTLAVELVATCKGYKLVKRIPSEPLRITDDPHRREVVDGVRYILPNREAKFELVFVRQ